MEISTTFPGLFADFSRIFPGHVQGFPLAVKLLESFQNLDGNAAGLIIIGQYKAIIRLYKAIIRLYWAIITLYKAIIRLYRTIIRLYMAIISL